MVRIVLFLLVAFVATLRSTKIEKSLFSYFSELSFSGSFDNFFETCLRVPNSLCLGGTSTVVTSNSVPKGLIAKWTFDDMYALDYSWNNNHMHKLVRAAPGFNGRGYSGAFVGDNSGLVHAGDTLKTKQFTIVFWIYLLERPTNNFRNVLSQIHKGEETIAVLLYPHVNKLSVRVLTDQSSNEGMSSMGQIPLRRWTNIAISMDDTKVEIYINGVLDNSVLIKQSVKDKANGNVDANGNRSGNADDSIEGRGGDITIGKNMHYSSFNGYLDELYFFNRSLNRTEINSFALTSVTGIHDPEFVYVGSYGCDYATSMRVDLCKENYHLCSSFQLYSGGIHYARINGILTATSNLWSSDVSENSVESGEKRIALCCRGGAANSPMGLVR
ncbi:conserved Plasmodium protein, unknown function [Plasmodium knowlesi strain H]|uniref:DUF8019 domain-containing protein n=3 Tax=Plasmodium knowlesi TaxID=5850 RepID=A0A5K1UX36_PLAKH|nr:uncharacterized protein PKNH_0318600 [Plasmodium knowlesi strain H]OTN68494.1 Uncharacterized protein PKNOH_S02311000 [Plasmodium knowlesi]CAA9986611.1 conserved Plasmodium protein, unknown function [Plasmodium knowlesi strain H]SBO24112.1 conserved Plasmodium protein, unknown function [Plasmodium knowlesi strain H]SBO29322.1 conserved Plasmodium protein, unknown function [Plasmodium knowlesi strain H]VVS76085.1 conserved Plasmodium protein, unknown function [Plasmodium knowlesi strain H]|eukprot:XP_002261151.1 [Plasmodium knowlesi strain H]